MLHLSNHLVAPWGPIAHQQVLEALRGVYRTRLAEPILVLAIVVQVVTGWRLWWRTRGLPERRWQRASGLYLSFFLVAHASAAFYQRLVTELDSNFYWAAAVVTWPLGLLYVPYYTLAVVSFCVHLGYGLRCAPLRVSVGVGLVISMVVIGALAGAFTPFELPAEYRIGG